jgi:uncharacterized membrane protein
VVAVFFFSAFHTETWKLAGMAIGVYTGGTPNMSAIGMSLEVDESVFVLMNTADVALGGMYLIFLMTIAHPLMQRILPKYENGKNQPFEIDHQVQKFKSISFNKKLASVAIALGLSLFCLLVGVGVSILITGKISVITTIITITTLAVIGSFVSSIRNLPGTYELGEYLLLVFCVAIGSLVSIPKLLAAGGEIFSFLTLVMFLAIIIHYLLAIAFRIDADTLLITSVAGIYGPAFVPPMASIMKNREILITGLASGILGYAVANYIGILIAYLLRGNL